ncbi:hypothetical protein AAC691_17130 [Nguyenibacter vanlangensis]|uniref:Uncharacterized protein n=1 Tax=Nguyenibacter vanlangensis TaxID=1216886 RepID=A0ABZ3D301_9PROT
MGATTHPRRQHWTAADVGRLTELWQSYGSIVLISRIMRRPYSSVQTQASRLSLPLRERSREHRRRWSAEDVAAFPMALDARMSADGLEIMGVAADLRRSVDAIYHRIASQFGHDSHYVLSIVVPSPPPAPAVMTARHGIARRCLRCTRPFTVAPADRKIVWRCNRCRTALGIGQDGSNSDDFSFYGDAGIFASDEVACMEVFA